MEEVTKLLKKTFTDTSKMSITSKKLNKIFIDFTHFSFIRDLAGGLAVQSCGMIFVKEVIGCYHNVMGFPMSKFYQKLSQFISATTFE